MIRIITFDICSVAILFCLIYSVFHRQITKGTANRLFFILIIAILCAGLSNIFRFVLQPVLPNNIFGSIVLYIAHYLYLIPRNLTLPLYSLFVISICGLWHEFKSNKFFHITWTITPLLIILTFFIDFFIHKLFTIGPDLSYERGPGMFLLYIFAFLVLLYSMVLLIVFRKRVTTKKFIALLLMYPICIAGILIQMLYPKYMVEVFSSTFPMLIISLAIQRPEEIINYDTGSLNYYACCDEINKNLMAKIDMDIIFICIDNFNILKNKLNYENLQSVLREMIQNIYEITGTDECECYYLDNGIFSVISTKANNSEIEVIGKKICEYFKITDFKKKIDLPVEVKVCFIKAPRDFSTLDSIINFSKKITDLITIKNEMVYLENELKSKEFQIKNNLDTIITRAIQQNKFQMYYQPIYNIEKKKFTSVEALIRLIDEEYGFISPALFIPAAEKSGAIHQIGDFVLEDVCHFIKSNQLYKWGIEYIEINLSVAQCIEKELCNKIETLLQKYELNSKFINLEITETATDYNHSLLDQNINHLWQKGIDFSLDDYGTGYSNIKRVMDLPLNIIKLDKSFADDFDKSEMQIVIQSTINMFRKIDKKLLIEGVETEEGKDYFEKAGCKYIQGYYFSKPLPAKDFIEFIKEKNGEEFTVEYE